ncbi:hypothetical protein GCM10009837_54120 [Streptomyces durmitorensis]|uniref:Lipoprotein n=1 Tax=Streptomyces durmitorensis TaxID=319947 RepID=A0ABY4PZP5_9ACTN|nr:hypothetical protein [Streptomyces durmitorensis]UQT58615.1 hypothetical protein M4V62_28045 [Streptomyces durmitorensis]
MLYAVGFAGAAVIGVAACDPVDGDMNTAAIAITTDEMATKELERQHLDVLWISCTARFKDKVTPSSGDPTPETVATVDCQGQARNGKGADDTSNITVKGTVWSVVDGHCVRGNLTAKVDGKEWFRVDVLGDCSGGDDGSGNGGGNGGDDHDGDKPTQPPEQPPGATATVTVTADPPPQAPDPTCSCFKGK